MAFSCGSEVPILAKPRPAGGRNSPALLTALRRLHYALGHKPSLDHNNKQTAVGGNTMNHRTNWCLSKTLGIVALSATLGSSALLGQQDVPFANGVPVAPTGLDKHPL